MTTISMADWSPSPEILIGQEEHRRLTIVALTELGERGDNTDLLLYELDRARIVHDAVVPNDVVRLGSMVRYQPLPGEVRIIKLVLPHQVGPAQTYRLSVTSEHGAALLGTRPGHVMTWLDQDGRTQRLKVLAVAPASPGDDPGPAAA